MHDPEALFCPTCHGSGRLADVDDRMIGETARGYRREQGVRAADLARQMGVGVWRINELESGRRRWTVELVRAYKAALLGVAIQGRGEDG